jgi:hypothetical protein
MGFCFSPLTTYLPTAGRRFTPYDLRITLCPMHYALCEVLYTDTKHEHVFNRNRAQTN